MNNRIHSSLCVVLAAALLAGCSGSSGNSSPSPPANLAGTWGGQTGYDPADFIVTGSGGTLKFMCYASDVLTQPLVVDSTGRFQANATVYAGLPMSPLPTEELTGTVHGSTMTVYVPSRQTTYTLTYGHVVFLGGGTCPAAA